MRKRARFWRRAAALGLAAGTLCQVGACPLTANSLLNANDLQPFIQLALSSATNLITDSVFFFLDNALVRLRG